MQLRYMNHFDNTHDFPVFMITGLIGLVSRMFFADVYLPLIMAVASGFLGVFAKKLGEYLFDLLKKKIASMRQKRPRRRSRRPKQDS